MRLKQTFPKIPINGWAFILYLLLPWLFWGIGINLVNTPLAPGDGYISGLPTKIFATTFSAWNPYLQAGTFAFKDMGFQALYPPALLLLSIFPNPFGYNLLILLHYSLTGFFTYLFLKRLSLNLTACLLGGLIFMFSGFLSAHLGHYMIISTSMYLPLLLYALETFFAKQKFIYLALAAFIFAASLIADYAAVSMYIGMVSFPYIIFRVFWGKEFLPLKTSHKFSWAILISLSTFIGGTILAAVQIVPVLESLPYITRQKISYEFFSSFSFPIWQIPSIIFPYLFGTTNVSAIYPIGYFGAKNFTEMSGYMGIFPLAAAALSAFTLGKKEKQNIFWLFVAIVGFFLVLGNSTPLHRIMYHIPGYNMFRAPARNWLEVNFAVAVLSALFIHHLKSGEFFDSKRYSQLIQIATALTPILLLFIITGWDNIFPELQNNPSWKASRQLTMPAVYIPILFIAITLIFLHAANRYKQKKIFWFAFSCLIYFDLFSFGYAYNANTYPTLAYFQNGHHPVYEYLNTNNPENLSYRIYSLGFYGSEQELQPDLNMLYNISVINGYSNVWLKAYSELTTFHANNVPGKKQLLLKNNKILSLLATKYIITGDNDNKLFLETITTNPNPYQKVYESPDGIAVYQNLNFLPRARFVNAIKNIKDVRASYDLLWNDPEFDPSTTALVEGCQNDTVHPGKVINADYSNNTIIKLEVETGEKSFLVLSDTWYPGWKVYVDGDKETLYKVYGIFRGVLIKGAGQHKVEFRFVPKSFYLGMIITVLATLSFLWTAILLDRKGKHEAAPLC